METSNSYRCQECDGTGKINRIDTGPSSETITTPRESEGYVDESVDWGRIRYRILECRDCGNTWKHAG